MTTHDRLTLVDVLLELPFPPIEKVDRHRSSGPSHHLAVLHTSRDFWDDEVDDVEEAYREVDQAHGELAAALTERWGGPVSIDLGRLLWSKNPVPEPLNQLAQYAGQLVAWPRPDLDRWVGLAVGQADRELPVQLLVAVGPSGQLDGTNTTSTQ